MITSMSVLTIRKGHEGDVVNILKDFVNKEKFTTGCIKAYLKKAIDNDDTYLVYAEYDTMENFQAANKINENKKEDEKVEFILRPHLLKGFYGNFV
jgi:heme-degrading monooxygenase HmoA